ncbi:MAG: fibronectin type III domain-containing protein, partial [Clostridiales bacterium]|nr:fibronectin type III domain-containing protein [Clostridiales bacterium]
SSTVSSVTVNVISDETDGEEYEITDYTSDLSSESISSIAIEDGIKIDVCNHYSQKIKDSKEATCTECGYTGDVVCNNCGEILEYGTTTDIITHSYSATVTEPTCTENGYTTYTCSICGDTYVDDETEATGHSYNNGEVTTAATCTTDGVKTYTCTECGETYTESIPATGHSYNTTVIAPTCTTKGYTLNTCENCSDSYKNTYVDVLGHDYSVLQSKAVSATCASTGKTAVYKCSRCPSTTGGTTIAKLAHTYKNVVTKATLKKNGKITPTCSVCGATKSATTIYYPKTIKLSATSYTYDKKKHKPSVTVKDSKGNTISSKYYTVTYSNSKSKSVGKYTVTIKFKGNYSGTKTLTYTIKPKSTSISKITAKSKGFTVKWKKQATQTTGYQIQYSTSSNFSNAKTVTISKTGTTSKTISKLKSKKKYYVRVRTYKTVKVNGKSTKIYSSWSKTKTVTTKK